jgi:hypothetical protein
MNFFETRFGQETRCFINFPAFLLVAVYHYWWSLTKKTLKNSQKWMPDVRILDMGVGT